MPINRDVLVITTDANNSIYNHSFNPIAYDKTIELLNGNEKDNDAPHSIIPSTGLSQNWTQVKVSALQKKKSPNGLQIITNLFLLWV